MGRPCFDVLADKGVAMASDEDPQGTGFEEFEGAEEYEEAEEFEEDEGLDEAEESEEDAGFDHDEGFDRPAAPSYEVPEWDT